MDGAILKTINVYPTGHEPVRSAPSTRGATSNVVTADIGIFHDTPIAAIELPQDATPELDYEAGLRDGKAKSDLVYQNTISVMQKAVNTLQAEIKNMARQIEGDHLSLVHKNLQVAFPSLIEFGTHAELKNLIAETTQTALSGRISFSVHPDSLEDCQRLCELQPQDFLVLADAQLSPSQIKVNWQNGGADIDGGAVLQDFIEAVESVLSKLKPDDFTERKHG